MKEVPRISKYRLYGYEFKLFVEGVEIPFSSLSLSTNPELTFNVVVPPFYEGLLLEANSNAMVIFRERRIDPKWYILCEGIYSGTGYSKTADSRSSVWMFRDAKWFYDSSRLFDITANESAFAPYEAVFFGDSKFANVGENNKTELQTNANFHTRAKFLEVLERSSNPIKDVISWVINNTQYVNDFIKIHTKGYKMNSNRFKIIENQRTREVFTGAVLSRIFNGIFNDASFQTTVSDLIWGLAQAVQYEITSVPCFLTENMEGWIIKPKMELVTPPSCNVLFPDETVSFNYSVDYHSQPTRYRFVDALISNGNEVFSYGYYAPKEIADNFNVEDISKKGIKAILTKEEKIKGIIPYESSLPYSQTIAMGFEGAGKEIIAAKSLYVDYLYYQTKFASTPLVVDTTFKPGLLPGFPVLVLDKEILLLGHLQAINMNIDYQNGYAMCSLTLTHVRPVDIKIPILAGWYDEKQFLPSNIGSAIYKKLHPSLDTCFGYSGKLPMVDGNNDVDFKQATTALLNRYMDSKDRVDFQKTFERKLPIFWDESNTGANSIAKKLGVKWNQSTGVLEPIGDSVMAMRYGDGFNVSEVRRTKVSDFKKRFENYNGVAERKFSNKESEK